MFDLLMQFLICVGSIAVFSALIGSIYAIIETTVKDHRKKHKAEMTANIKKELWSNNSKQINSWLNAG